MSQIKEIIPGDLVKWFETYADINTIRDYGMGTVINREEVQNPYDPHGTVRYRVFCHKLGDTRWFVKPYIEKFTKGEQNVRT